MSTPHITNVSLSDDFKLLVIKTSNTTSTITIDPRCDIQRHTMRQRTTLKSISDRGNRILKRMNQFICSVFKSHEKKERMIVDLTGKEQYMIYPSYQIHYTSNPKHIVYQLYKKILNQVDEYLYDKKTGVDLYLYPYVVWVSLTQLSSEQMNAVNMFNDAQGYEDYFNLDEWIVIN